MSSQHSPNRLSFETSPYLLQHAHNPVDWFPWGEEAFAKAKSENKPILLSIGYSACHWCHVMECECFENDLIAALMNRDFVSIKVDREERPEIDAIYMSAVQMLTGQGGWPMTVIMTPEGHPFFGGTYFPPEDRYGRPGFPRVLESAAHTWKTQRVEIEQHSMEIQAQLTQSNSLILGQPESLLSPSTLETAFTNIAQSFDSRHGGFGTAPKFPQPSHLDFLLRFHARTGRDNALQMVEKTLQRMALGGIYDQLGGGFHRYSTDQFWLAPHFEKMLYDNAQLAQTYAHCYQVSGNAFYKGVAEETLEYVHREMTGEDGEFYSAQDADSDGVEGKFFVWSENEIREALGEEDAEVFSAFYDVTQQGNWEGHNILRVVMDAPEVALKFCITIDEAAEILDGARIKLFKIREERIKPALDDKTLASWNGLMLSAMAECGAIFGRQDFIKAANANADFLLGNLSFRDSEGYLRLRRTHRLGQSKLNGCLEDYAFLTEGLIRLYEATFELRWLETARELLETMLKYFWDDLEGGFFTTSTDHEKLIQRLKDWDDNAIPSGNTVAMEVMVQIANITGDNSLTNRVSKILRKLSSIMSEHPFGFTRLLGVLDALISPTKEVVIVGDVHERDTQTMHASLYRSFLPNHIFVHAISPETASNWIPLLEQRPMLNRKPTAYVCENMACKAPTTDFAELERQLRF